MKNKPKVLLVAGCSHSAGCEIFVKSSQQDPRFHTERSYRELKEKEIYHSFGGHIARKNNLIHVNVASPATDNLGIIKNTIKKINQLLKEYKPYEIVVLVGWTGFFRLTFNMNSDLSKIEDRNLRKLWKLWSKLVIDIDTNAQIFLYQFLRSFLREKNISYYMFNAMHSMQFPTDDVLINSTIKFVPSGFWNHTYDSTPDFEGFKILSKDCYFRYPFSQEETYMDYLIKRGCSPKNKKEWNHFDEAGHIMWADVLNKEMLELNLF